MQFQLTFFLHLGLLGYTKAEDECNRGACHPTTGNLLVGRNTQLMASSTCGLNGAQKYCILGYLEVARLKDRYGRDHVSIRLDLEALFQFSHLILTFKTFQPAAMLVERSTDYGHTWKVLKYFAKDCATSFPNITSGPAQGVRDLVCDSKYSDIEPSTGGEVVLKVLDLSFESENFYSPYIQDLVTLTNLRINFNKLHTLGDTLLGRRQNDSLNKYYYALYEIVVWGSCFCNGHASECGPTQKVQGDVFSPPGMVSFNLKGQLALLPFHHCPGAQCRSDLVCGDQQSKCQPSVGAACSCNGHSDSCHFDMNVYLASGGVSGGVCEDCRHNTKGPHCDRCRPLFYREPLEAISDPYACLPCECDPDGTISGVICVSHSDPALEWVAGQCLCKENVEGAKCDQCKPKYYGLSVTDPKGCQPCNCNPFGSLPLSTCNVDTGHCLCKPFVIGPHCEECTVGYWGLENHPHGCSPCDCDIGGAYSNMCSPKDGQCECHSHVTGRSCTEPAPGYFFASLNFYLYEAEEATPLQGLAPLILATALPTCDVYFQQQGSDFIIDKGNIVLKRNQKHNTHADKQSEVSAPHVVLRDPGTPATWTGHGLARVLPGAGLRFAVNNIPFPMDFTMALHYETQSTADWAVQIVINPPGGSEHCTHKTLPQKSQSFALPAASRIQYELGLIPQINSLENFCSKQDLDDYQLYNCVEIALETRPKVLPGTCKRLIVSMSARLHNGAVACKCHPQGSVGTSCSQLGGQCQCKPHVAGRCCDRCSAGSYGFGHQGCHACHCHHQGSKSTVCDQITGQCPCQEEVAGRRCDQCLQGYFGFPNCLPCRCNGFAELCDPETGLCFNCGRFTTGRNCERCINGYYGNPSLGQSCRPCLCPDVPSSNWYFAHSYYQNSWSSEVICNCLESYAGKQCEECSAGFYGNPRISGAPCRPCACNNNIDITDPESCSQVTGECLKCLHNTQGPNCQLCKPGHFGSAFNQTCRRCSCHPSGVNTTECPPGRGLCLCDPDTGTCPCLPNVTGQTCDHCANGYWNLVPGRGCQPCNCDPRTSHSNHCDQLTCQCSCKLGYDGKHCSDCKEDYYGDPLGRCIACDCNREGTQRPTCDRDTGMCRCREGISGQQCDHCTRRHGQEFPACPPCHLRFDQWDHSISSLSRAVQGLIRLAANMKDKRETLPVCDADFKGLKENMSEIERILKHPVFSLGEFLKVKDYDDSVGKQIMQLNEQLKAVYAFPDLKETIVKMRNEADLLLENLQEETDLLSSVHNTSIMDSSENIKKYYQRSLSAEKKTNETTSILSNSEKIRNDLLTILDMLTSKENLSLENLKQIKIPDIQILKEKLCGEPGDVPCVLSFCGGPSCRDSLALSGNALQKAQEAKSIIYNLSNQVQGWKNQIKNISKLAEVSKNNTLQLSEKLRNMKNRSESEKEKMNLLIKKLKKFLSEENVPPEDIEKVANRVLNIHLPITSQNLTQELDKIWKFMQLCEAYRTDEDKLNKTADGVRKILVKAKAPEKSANVLLNLNKILNKLQQVQITQERANSTITQLTAEITKIKKNILQAENQAKETKHELNLAKQQSALKDGLSQLRIKLQRNQEQVIHAEVQAELAGRQAGSLEEKFVELQTQYAMLQHKTSATGLAKEVLGKVKQLKDPAEKLAGDTVDKIRRITDLEKKIQDLNISRQEKADQLKELEDQVIGIKNEIDEQENKYATCYT